MVQLECYKTFYMSLSSFSLSLCFLSCLSRSYPLQATISRSWYRTLCPQISSIPSTSVSLCGDGFCLTMVLRLRLRRDCDTSPSCTSSCSCSCLSLTSNYMSSPNLLTAAGSPSPVTRSTTSSSCFCYRLLSCVRSPLRTPYSFH